MPEVDLGSDTAMLCSGSLLLDAGTEEVSYLWDNGSTEKTRSVDTTGLYKVTISREGCFATDSIYIKVPVINIGNDTVICKESILKLDAGISQATYLWDDGSTAKNREVKESGTYHVEVIEGTCLLRDSIRVDTFPTPALNIGNDTSICRGNTVTLTASPPDHRSYNWHNGTKGISFTTAQAGIFSVTIIDEHYCSASDSVNIKLSENPVINLPEKIRACRPEIYLNPGEFSTYKWHDGTSSNQYFVNDYGSYTVTVTDTNACSDTRTVLVENSCPPNVFMPNAFTPNNDLINDVYKPVLDNISEIHFSIYNLWGELLFETKEKDHGWTGEHAPAGVYYYIIAYKGMNGKRGSYGGNFTLLK